jgi:hypothetical protein
MPPEEETKPERVIIADYSHTLTGEKSRIGGFHNAQLVIGQGITFFDGDSIEKADRFTILPWHAFDLLEVDKISHQQWEMEDPPVKIPTCFGKRPDMKDSASDRCFGKNSEPTMCPHLRECTIVTNTKASDPPILPVCFGKRTADGPSCPGCEVLTNCMLKFQERI